jgi:hypothetical protein
VCGGSVEGFRTDCDGSSFSSSLSLPRLNLPLQDKGWNLFIGGNGGANPVHAILFAKDVPPSKVVRLVDRFVRFFRFVFPLHTTDAVILLCPASSPLPLVLSQQLMFYIRTADKLQRTAPWVAGFEGGIEKLKDILINDSLGICGDLEAEMDNLIGFVFSSFSLVLPLKAKTDSTALTAPTKTSGPSLSPTRRSARRSSNMPTPFVLPFISPFSFPRRFLKSCHPPSTTSLY